MARHAGRHHAAGRHAGKGGASPARLVASAVCLALVLAVLGWVAWPRLDPDTRTATGECSGRGIVTVSTSAAMQPALAEIAALVPPSSCETFEVTAGSPAEVVERYRTDQAPPQIWVPDSPAAVALVNSAAAAPLTALESIASTPIVLAVPRSQDAPASFTWGATIVAETTRLPDPNTSTVGQIVLTAGLAEIESLPPAQGRAALRRIGGMLSRIVPEATLFPDYVSGPDPASFPTTEQQVTQAGDAAVSVRAASRTPQLQYPLLTSDAAAARAAAALREAATSAAGQAVLRQHGFRTPADATPVVRGAPPQDEVGVELTAAQASAAARIQASISTPTRLLTVIDTSGSMVTPGVGGASRIEVATAAATGAIQLLADRNSVGLWSFSTAQDGSRDWTQIQPINRLDQDNHRAALAYSLGSLASRLGGDTGLYDTIDAAYSAVLKDHDPKAANLITVFTDGLNDDPAGGIGLSELTTRLAAKAEKKKPITVLLIGMGDVDAKALAPVAAAIPSSGAGGASIFTIAKPEDIGDVYAAVLLKRVPPSS